MAFLIGGANSAADTAAYDIANSCMFDDGDAADLTRSKGTQTSLQIGTISFWIKRVTLGIDMKVYTNTVEDDNNRGVIQLPTTDQFRTIDAASDTLFDLKASARSRDPAAWSHWVLAIDTTQSTDTNRIKLYHNGTLQTSFATESYCDQNQNLKFFEGGQTDKEVIGGINGETSDGDFYLAEFIYCDGQQYAASDFGEFDSDSPLIWKPTDPSSLTFGNEGFWLDFEDSSALGNDVSGNNNDFTANNLAATDQCLDSPTNNFCVMNTLDKYWPTTGTAPAFHQGNLKVVGGSGSNSSTGYSYYTSTFGLSAGKWYWEVHITDIPSGGGQSLVGIIDVTQRYNQNLGEIVDATGITWGIKNNGHLFNNNTGAAETGTFVEGDTVGIALDITNSKIYFSKGGAWSDGNEAWDSTTFNASVGDVDITAVGSTHNGHWFATVGGTEYSKTTTWTLNFGSPVLSISSGNADENGYGNFEYAVPDGFLAVCTKNLGSAGG